MAIVWLCPDLRHSRKCWLLGSNQLLKTPAAPLYWIKLPGINFERNLIQQLNTQLTLKDKKRKTDSDYMN